MKTLPMETVFDIGPNSSGHETDGNWSAEFESRWLCPECRCLDHALREREFDIVLASRPRQAALEWARGPLGIYSLIRRDFAELVLRDAADEFALGRVFLSGGKSLPDYATYLGKLPQPIRGGPDSRRRWCSTCGSFIYTPTIPWYVLREGVSGPPVCQSGFGAGLLMRSEVAERIDRKRWKGLRTHKLPVLDEPQDGIADFPENWYYRGDAS